MMDKIEARTKWLKTNGKGKWLKAKAHEVPKQVIHRDKRARRDTHDTRFAHTHSVPPPEDSPTPPCISMPRKHDDRGIPRRQVHEVPQSIASRWNRYLARDPPSYDSGIPIPPSYWWIMLLSEADAKTLMDKIEARSKWLKANSKAPKSLGKHQRVILARAKSKADVTMDATTHKPSDVDGHRP